MATEVATAYISIVSSARGLGQSISGELDDASTAADAAGNKAGSKFGGAFGKAASLIGAVGIGAFLADSVKSLSNIEAINAQTASAIATTGGAAQVSSQHVQDLALSLEGMSAQERESIQSGANFLLTFKNIKNGLGAGNDVFDQTTQAMVDLSVATGTDMQGAALQLGKALNDPIAGVSALSRVGVTFTDQQKAQIKAMQDVGDTAGAQKVILAELNSEFGGSGAAYAKTFAGRMYFLTDAIGGVGEAIVGKAMGPLGGLAEVGTNLANGVADWITNFNLFNGSLGSVGKGLAEVFSILAKGDFKGLAGLEEDSPLVNGLFLIREGAQDAASALHTMATGDFTGMNFFNEDSPFVGGLIAIHQAGQDAAGALKILATGDYTGLNFFQEDSPFVNGLFTVREAVQDVGGALHVIATGQFGSLNGLNFFDNDSPFVKGLFAAHQGIQDIGGSLKILATGDYSHLNFFQEDSPFVAGLLTARTKVIEFGQQIAPALSSAFDKAKPVLATIGAGVIDNLKSTFSQLVPVFTTLFAAIGPVLSNLIAGLAPVFAQIGPVIGQLLPLLNPVSFVFKALLPILPKLAEAFGKIAIAVSAGLGQALAAIAPLLPVIAGILTQITTVIAQGLVQAVQGLLPLFDTLVGVITTLIPPIMALVTSLLPPLMGVFQSLVPLVSAVVSVVVDLVNTLVSVLIPVINALLPVVQTVFGFIADYIKGALDIIKGIIEVVTGIITGDWSLVWEGIKGIVTGVWEEIKAVIGAALAVVGAALSLAWEGIKAAARLAWEFVQTAVTGPLGEVLKFVSGVFAGIVGFFDTYIWAPIRKAAQVAWEMVYKYIVEPLQQAWDWVKNIFPGIVAAAKKVWDDLKDALNPFSTSITVTGSGLAGGSAGIQLDLPKKAKGGVINPTPGGTAVIVGEARQQELITPTGLMRSVFSDVLSNTTLAGGDGVTLNFNHYGSGEVAPEAVVAALNDYYWKHSA